MAKDEQNEVLFEEGLLKSEGPVECLGKTFENDDARREHFLGLLMEKLKDPEFRKIEGFPIGEDEDILALSDPPFYTACPNPFVDEFVRLYGKLYDPETDSYHREPFASDISEGKNDPIYMAHSYHTKVPHKAIMRYILHYTEPGHIVLDGFCGTGMTGVAARFCSDAGEVESLGYRVLGNGEIVDAGGNTISRLGARPAIQNDLSPAATFIASNYNAPFRAYNFKSEANRILDEVRNECSWMYSTLHDPTSEQLKEALSTLSEGTLDLASAKPNMAWGKVNYTIWSDVFTCTACSGEVVFWDVAVDYKSGEVRSNFSCPHCGSTLRKRGMERSYTTYYDRAIGENIRQARQIPVWIIYSVGKKRHEKKPDEFDFALLDKLKEVEIRHWFPTERMPAGDESRRNDSMGIRNVHHFYTQRDLAVISATLDKARSSQARSLLMLGVTSLMIYASRLSRWRLGNRSGPLSGTLYISSTVMPLDALTIMPNRFKRMEEAANKLSEGLASLSLVGTHSSTQCGIRDSSIDYIFTDPPFGGNLMYSELNFIWEAWLKVFTNNKTEAVQNKTQGKGPVEYQDLMTNCFSEYYRVLKPGRWMTVEFHNSKNAVWNAIQEAIQHAGFIVADVRVLDKKQGTFKQVSAAGAVKQDLVISAYKPNSGLEERFRLEAGTEEGAWDFVRTHLKQLPVFVSSDGKAEVVAERQNYLLFDRMVAFHVQRGVTVPLSAGEFYAGLIQRFIERDGMFFLADQAPEYDKKRMKAEEVIQLELFVTDESSAIQWLKQQLTGKPQTFQELHPAFMREIAGWEKYEKPLELLDLLNENFLLYDGAGDVPPQIHSYLSSNYKDLRKLEKEDPALKDKAKGRYYVPDPNKAQDLEKMRERSLLKEFEEYRQAKTKKLKVFRVEAVRAGFKKAWQERDYGTIIDVAEKIPEAVLQEDAKLLMWYDQARTRAGSG